MDSSVALREAGLRVTAQRRAVLGALQAAAHATAAEIASRIAELPVEIFPGVSRQGLYNVLEDRKGFTVEEAEITWWGECMECTAASPLPTEEGDSA
jgi:Fe2+ or Zn2+ uptake regulation protein